MKKLHIIVFCLTALSFLFYSGCKDMPDENPVAGPTSADEPFVDINTSRQQILGKYRGFSFRTYFQLLSAMIATARYHNINRAIRAEYEDANIFMPHMGYHYLKSKNLDDKFNPAKPELLVYSPNPHNGKMRLVALEYAVPIALSPDGPPEGFAGNADVWNKDLTFDLWTLHAWVWKYNPDGVFNATNSRVNP